MLISPDEICSFVESSLCGNGLMMHRALNGKPGILGVTRIDDPKKRLLNRKASFVPSSALGNFGRHPALAIWTHTSVGGIRVVEGNAHRTSQLALDRNRLVLVHVPEPNGLIVGGLGTQVSSIVRMLHLIVEVVEGR